MFESKSLIKYTDLPNRSPYRIQCNSSSKGLPIGDSVIVALTDVASWTVLHNQLHNKSKINKARTES